MRCSNTSISLRPRVRKCVAGSTPVRAAESRFLAPGQARDIERVKTRRGTLYVVARNNDYPLVFRTADRE